MPDTLDDLSDALAAHLGDGHRPIVGALTRLARDLAARLAAASVVLPPEIGEALSMVEAWERGQAGDDRLADASALLDERLDRAGAGLDETASAAVLVALGIVRAATYEDHDDWPSEVVVPAAELLMSAAGLDERAAARWAARYWTR